VAAAIAIDIHVCIRLCIVSTHTACGRLHWSLQLADPNGYLGVTVPTLKCGYYLDGSKATLISAADDIRILASVEARSG
jgi:hypothetical protein